MTSNNPEAELVEHIADANGASRAKSSTERGQEFRKRQRDLGGKPSGMLLSSQARLAIEVIRQVRRKPYKVRIMEEALVSEARRLCPCIERLSELVQKGLLDGATASGWEKILVSKELLELTQEQHEIVHSALKRGDPVKESAMKIKRIEKLKLIKKSGQH